MKPDYTLWYLREFDFLPCQLSGSMYNGKLSRDFWKHIDHFKFYKTKEEAMVDANRIRELVGLPKCDQYGSMTPINKKENRD